MQFVIILLLHLISTHIGNSFIITKFFGRLKLFDVEKPSQHNKLYAKKKGSKLVSDDFLTTLENTFEDYPSVESISIAVNGNDESNNQKKPIETNSDQSTNTGDRLEEEKSVKKKKKKGGGKKDYFADIDAELSAEKNIRSGDTGTEKGSEYATATLENDSIDEYMVNKKQNEDDTDHSDSDDVDPDDKIRAVDPDGLTIEQRVRKEKPPSRVRFAESSQPDFVMMALENVGLMYGNDVVLKSSSFSVKTGERVGLVGPNGSGKVRKFKLVTIYPKPSLFIFISLITSSFRQPSSGY